MPTTGKTTSRNSYGPLKIGNPFNNLSLSSKVKVGKIYRKSADMRRHLFDACRVWMVNLNDPGRNTVVSEMAISHRVPYGFGGDACGSVQPGNARFSLTLIMPLRLSSTVTREPVRIRARCS